MTPKAAVSSMIRSLYSWAESIDIIDESVWCPRCGAVMQIASAVPYMGRHLRVVSPILVSMCPRCEYAEHSWTC